MFGTWSGIPDRSIFTYTNGKVPVKPVSTATQYRWNGEEDRLKDKTVGPTGKEKRGEPAPVARTIKLSNFFY